MEAWNTLINTSLLGTEKAPGDAVLVPDLPGLNGAQRAMNARENDAETRLLETTAVLYIYRRCGTVPFAGRTRADAAEREIKPYCSAAATTVLKDILLTGSTGLLQLWLERCDANASLVPAVLIDTLLHTAVQQKSLRPLILSCCGKRGKWLCKLNPDWSFGAESTDEEHWETGSAAARALFLKNLRATDPDAARALLEAVWGKEKADVKEALLASLQVGLSHTDLPFLESAGADKSKRVQALAYDLLTRLPGSSIVKAIEEVLRQVIQLQTTKKLLGMMSKTTLEIILPKDLDKTLTDAIGKKPAELSLVSEEEYRLVKMMSSVPPSFWEAHLGLAPARILELFEEATKTGAYKDALREAAIRFGARDWAPLFKEDAGAFHAGLMPLLPKADRQSYLLSSAKSAPEDVIRYYTAQGLEWSNDIAPLLMPAIAANVYQYQKGFFHANAHLMPLSIAPQLASFAPPADAAMKDYARLYAAQTWPKTAEYLTELLALKQKTIAAFPAQNTP